MYYFRYILTVMTWKFEKWNSENRPIQNDTCTERFQLYLKIIQSVRKNKVQQQLPDNQRIMEYPNNLYISTSGIYQTNCSTPC